MAITSASTWIRNETPARLTLIGVEDERLVLAPLQEKAIGDVSAFDFEDAVRDGILSTGEDAPYGLIDRIGAFLYGGTIAAFVLGVFLSNTFPQWRLAPWVIPAVILLLVLAGVVIWGTNSSLLVARVAAQLMALVVILAIGVGLPSATIYFFGRGHELFSPDANPLLVFGRLIQLSFIATASLLPVLLFFLFDRFQLGTIRKRLYGSLFRLDPSIQTINEIDAKYGSEIREAYGSPVQGRGRLTPASRWPVLICAFVITIGWIVTLAPVGADFNPEDRVHALEALLPQRTAFVFGFLGVYFFSLRLIAIRYARGDLKPKTYTHIMVRIFIVAVLSWVLDAIFVGESRVMLVLAFLFGITPDEFFTWLKAAFRGSISDQVFVFPEPTKLPLNDLEGIDLYELARLESEGIVNIEGLAHHELIDLIIETRVPVPRLIDWMDQSILYLHLVGGSESDGRAKLRDYGIRTATDLLRAWDQAKGRGDAEFEAFKKLLGGQGPPYRLEVIRDALQDDEWMTTVSCWRQEAVRKPIERRAVPSSVEALERWADRQLKGEPRYGRALKILTEESLEIRDTASTRRRIARIYATSTVPAYCDSVQARENAARAFELAPNDHKGIAELIDIYMALKDYAEAKKMCDVAIEIVSNWKDSEQKSKETKRLKGIQKQITDLASAPSA
jgi:tetratricopeptide (TPR) repeat protein